MRVNIDRGPPTSFLSILLLELKRCLPAMWHDLVGGKKSINAVSPFKIVMCVGTARDNLNLTSSPLPIGDITLMELGDRRGWRGGQASPAG